MPLWQNTRKHTKIANFFNHPDINVKFFLLPTLKSFDAIQGNDSLKELNAEIEVSKKIMKIKNIIHVPIKEKKFEAVNTIVPRIEHLNKFQNQIYTTNVKAEIR